jgi:hypothetical protein
MRCVRRGVSFEAFLYKNLACLMSLGLIMFCVEMHSRGDNVWRGGLMMNSAEIALGRSPTRTHTTQQTPTTSLSHHSTERAASAASSQFVSQFDFTRCGSLWPEAKSGPFWGAWR